MITDILKNNWEFYKGSLGGPWEIWRHKKLSNHFNVPWVPVTLPHCFNALDAVDPDQTYYQGDAYYRTEIEINNPFKKGRTLLHFEGVGQTSEVYIHTKKVGEHVGGYDEFTIDITDAVSQYRNDHKTSIITLAVKASNQRDLETIPSDVSDFNLYGGIHRKVHLQYVPEISIDKVFLNPSVGDEGEGVVSGKVCLYNPHQKEENAILHFQVKDAQGQLILSSSREFVTFPNEYHFILQVDSSVELWDTENPYLYDIETSLQIGGEETQMNESFGFRMFHFEMHGAFYLNGKRLLLQGTHRHEDHAGLGSAMSDELILDEMRMIKQMGANFIRLGHYQQSKFVLECCDQLGLLVWEEIPWCRGGLGGQSYQEMCERMLTNMIEQHYNHPSIILWGLGNENDWECDFDYFDTEAIREFMQKLQDIAHSLDPNRKTSIRRCDFCKDIPDTYSPSIWAGWYRGIYEDYQSSLEKHRFEVPHMLHAEWGADNHTNRHTAKPYTGKDSIVSSDDTSEKDGDYLLSGGDPRVSTKGDWSESYFCDLIDHHLLTQKKLPWFTGSAQWPFKDFSTPVRPENPIPYVNQKGVVERDLTPKEGYYVFQSHWATEPMIHVYGSTWKYRYSDNDEGTITIKVYSNCDEVTLILNGESIETKKKQEGVFPAFGYTWEIQPKEGVNKISAVGYLYNKKVISDLEFEFVENNWGEPAQLHIEVDEQTQKDEIFVETTVRDSEGNICHDATNRIEYQTIGECRPQYHQGTIRGSKIVEASNGRSWLQISKIKEPCIIAASSEGLESATLILASNSFPEKVCVS